MSVNARRMVVSQKSGRSEKCSQHHTAPIRAVVCFALALTAGCGGSGAPKLQDAEKPVAELRTMLKDESAAVQARGALGLSRAGAEARDAVPDLVPLLKSGSALVRQNAAQALGQIGADAKPALPALKKLDGDANKQVRDAAKKARDRIGG
jgi:hypothetical protein